MNTNLVKDTVDRFIISGSSAAASWGLQDISYMLSICASIIAILVGLSTFYNIIQAWRLKK